MIFSETPLKNAFVVDVKEISDDRGFFAWGFWAKEFEDHGLKPAVAQVNLSFSKKEDNSRPSLSASASDRSQTHTLLFWRHL